MDRHYLGAAALRKGYQRRLKRLQNMGCNSIRLCHNPHAPILLNLANKMGIEHWDADGKSTSKDKCLLVVRSNRKSEKIIVKATAEALPEQSIAVNEKQQTVYRLI